MCVYLYNVSSINFRRLSCRRWYPIGAGPSNGTPSTTLCDRREPPDLSEDLCQVSMRGPAAVCLLRREGPGKVGIPDLDTGSSNNQMSAALPPLNDTKAPPFVVNTHRCQRFVFVVRSAPCANRAVFEPSARCSGHHTVNTVLLRQCRNSRCRPS